MDPYLEDPRLWPDFHGAMIFAFRVALNQLLQPRYFARAEERVYVSDEYDPGRPLLIPDLRVAWQPHQPQVFQAPLGTVAAAEPIEVETPPAIEVREARLEVIARVLCPTNKVNGSRGRSSYLEKRRELMDSTSHLVEIDLLRDGAPLSLAERLPPHEYLIAVTRHGSRGRSRVWPIRLPQPLPVVPVPLRDGDPDAPLDLQAILGQVYDQSSYELEFDYRQEPAVPLQGEAREWANRLLRERGLRGAE
jgi:hypothetical protein